mgnify:CR=1 FL=1
MGTNILVTAIVIVYLLVMLWIGWYSSTKISTNTDFMVAGRRLGPLLMAGTLAATEIGGGSSLGVVQNGMSGFGLSASWYITTMGIAFIILSFIAPKFRAATVKDRARVFPQALRQILRPDHRRHHAASPGGPDRRTVHRLRSHPVHHAEHRLPGGRNHRGRGCDRLLQSWADSGA